MSLILYECDGEVRSLRQWASLLRVPYGRLLRLHAIGVPVVLTARMKRQAHVSTGEPGAPGSWTWHALDYEDDVWAQDFVRKHPRGASLEAVADALGMTRERVSQLQDEIFAKLRAARDASAQIRELLEAA